jgi:6,7-dimethyl-8-ribityllumazine synthase
LQRTVIFANALGTGSDLRIGIVHARWNPKTVESLVAGAKKTLKAAGVRDENVIVQDVAGSWELPIAVQRYVRLLGSNPPSLVA